MASDFDAIFYVREPPDITLVEGLFHIGYNIGKNARFEIVLSPSTYAKALKRANRVSDEFHAECRIVPFHKR